MISYHLFRRGQIQEQIVVEKFEAHFVKNGVIFKRAKFNQRRQEEGKSVDDFVTSLYCQLEHCCYGDFQDELIRDRIVVGLKDSTLSEKLQLDPTLMLETAITAARQSKEAAAGYKD